jgi:hypothetical protein
VLRVSPTLHQTMLTRLAACGGCRPRLEQLSCRSSMEAG